MNNTTAKVAAFARAYHTLHYQKPIFKDELAFNVLTEEEYNDISRYMTQGIQYFAPGFSGTDKEALDYVIENQLSPTPLARSVFAEKALENAVFIGATQYLLLGAGYDTFAYRVPSWSKNIHIFELDRKEMSLDKKQRMEKIGQKPFNLSYISADFSDSAWVESLRFHRNFNADAITFCSLLGVVYYLSTDLFIKLIGDISSLLPKGSSIVLDYPDDNQKGREKLSQQNAMAEASNEPMKGQYSFKKMEQILSEASFLVYEHLTPKDITQRFFRGFNQNYPAHTMKAFSHVNYCLAVKQS